ncbi:MAG: hypothetical protein QW063_02545 [Candidatus Nanoarchaeia archaeon]
MVKRGFFFWIEMIFLIIIITIVVLNLPKSENNFLSTKGMVDLEQLGFSALQALDQQGIFENYMNTTNFAASNFTALSLYIRKSLPSTIKPIIEYTNGTHCRNESGFIVSCGNFTMAANTIVSDYTCAKLDTSITIRLYLREVFS